MLPKKLKLNPPKNPPQQTTPRIKFTNLNKDKTQPGITVDEEARRRQNEHVKAAARGQVFKSTETPVRMSQRGSVNRDLPHVAAPEANVGAASKSSEPVASVSGVDKQENAQGDIKMADVPPETDKANVPSVAQTITQGDSSTTTMQPPAVVPQQFQQSQAVPHPPLRPVYPVNPVTTAFDRVTRDPGKGKLFP